MGQNNKAVLQSEIERFLKAKLSCDLGPAFEVVAEYRDKENHLQDIAVLHNRKLIAFIECKRNAQEFVQSFLARQWLEVLFKNHEAEYYFVADQTECYLFKPDNYVPKKLSIDEGVSIIASVKEIAQDPPTLAEIQSLLEDVAKNHKLVEKIRPLSI